MKTFPAILTFLALIFASALGKELDNKTATDLKVEIQVMMENMQKGEYDQLFEKTHPSLKKLVGGEKAYQKMLAATAEMLNEADFTIESTETGKPGELIKVGTEEISFVPNTTVMVIQGIKMKSTGFMVAIRDIDGKEWKFLDGAGFRTNPDLFKQLFPNAPKDLKMPENKIEQVK